ncbi:MAG: hypothetical protein CVV56_07765 [Tenericutes bacterium HGW-Tenericutes-1]|jgi:hypothetical protein|nr:MAG: hypothetical protein CVV56_07765 [Tenericutes bacterium HGW-Tenericutes-1]
MKKKFYDFSIATAIIVILAYSMVFILSIYTILDSESIPIGGIVFTSLLAISFVGILVYYGMIPIVLTDFNISHGKKNIDKQNAIWGIRRNYRYRYDELVIRDKMINYRKLPRKEIKKCEIVVQHFPKYEIFLENYLGPSDGSIGE